MALILASGSPRRRELMSLITPDYTVITSDVDETKIAADSPAHLAKALATAKARAVAEENPDDVVCGFDTVVECEGEVFGKPGSRYSMSLPTQESFALPLPRRSSTSVKLESTAPLMAVVPEIRWNTSSAFSFRRWWMSRMAMPCLSASRLSTDRSR